MKYTKQELIWLKNLVDKAVIEASENMELCKGNPIGNLAELKRDNMRDLSEKLRKDIRQRNGRTER